MLLSDRGANDLHAGLNLTIRRPRKHEHQAPTPRGDRVDDAASGITVEELCSSWRWHSPAFEEWPPQPFELL
jgi:hypothetical protein